MKVIFGQVLLLEIGFASFFVDRQIRPWTVGPRVLATHHVYVLTLLVNIEGKGRDL